MTILGSVSKNIAKEVGDNEMKHVTCVDHACSIKLCSLFKEEKRYSNFWKKEEKSLDFSLLDILESSSSLPETDVKGPFTFKVTVFRRAGIGATVDAAANLNAAANVNAAVDASDFHEFSLEYQIVTIHPRNLEVLRKRKLLEPLPPDMDQYRQSGKNLYVVTKVVELLNSPVLRYIGSGGTSGGVSFHVDSVIQAKAEGEGQMLRDMELTLQKGMVMAYKKQQLFFENNGFRFHITKGKKQKCCPIKLFRPIYRLGRKKKRSGQGMYKSSGPMALTGSLEELSGQEMEYVPIGPMPPKDFERMTDEVSIRVRKVASLSRNIQGIIFVNIQAMLRDRQALEDLMDTLDQVKSLGHLSGPGATILDELGRIPGYPHVDAVDLILYLLEAIMVLSDTQHALLAQSMEKRILPHQRDLVWSILEPNFNYPQCIPFILDPELLAPLQGEGVAITYGLLQECGLRMELNNPRSTWDLEAKESMSALYASLCLLQKLSEA